MTLPIQGNNADRAFTNSASLDMSPRTGAQDLAGFDA
jgi:hypothetical protein